MLRSDENRNLAVDQSRGTEKVGGVSNNSEHRWRQWNGGTPWAECAAFIITRNHHEFLANFSGGSPWWYCREGEMTLEVVFLSQINVCLLQDSITVLKYSDLLKITDSCIVLLLYSLLLEVIFGGFTERVSRKSLLVLCPLVHCVHSLTWHEACEW